MTFTYTCDQGHEPKTFTATGEDKNAAAMAMLPEVKAHLGELHSDMGEMTDEQIMTTLMDEDKGMKEAEATAEAEQPMA